MLRVTGVKYLDINHGPDSMGFMGKKILGLMVLALTVSVSRAELREFVVLRTAIDDQTTVSGDTALADVKFTPASTFKVLIAWAALEEGLVTPETKYWVNEKHVPGGPRELTLCEAMFFSSNDYFDWLGKRLGREKLEQYITRSGYAGGQVPQGWLDDLDAVERGGTLTITPRENHEFMRKIAARKLASSARINSDLWRVLHWPGGADKVKNIYGKTGSADGALWFNGFAGCCELDGVVTVMARDKASQRLTVIKKFYAQFGVEFDEAWLKAYQPPAPTG
ncbi:MAG: serine hydrolase [Verrucomicrobiales bacterium]|jgi:beta-lactamase class D|nr:serine hydrolase [Verrucomicrobiales bacterium]